MDAFGVSTDRAYERSLKLFEAFLVAQCQQGKVPTLFVDEAQNMTRDILKLIHYLLNYETSDAKLLQIVLTGQEEVSQKVKRYKELASRMIPIAINPMSPIDLEDMLKFRWSIASGNKSELPFTQERGNSSSWALLHSIKPLCNRYLSYVLSPRHTATAIPTGNSGFVGNEWTGWPDE